LNIYRRPLRWRGFHINGPAVEFDNLVRQEQADAGAVAFGRELIGKRVVEGMFGYARAVISN